MVFTKYSRWLMVEFDLTLRLKCSQSCDDGFTADAEILAAG
jgi:hypothetical protein